MSSDLKKARKINMKTVLLGFAMAAFIGLFFLSSTAKCAPATSSSNTNTGSNNQQKSPRLGIFSSLFRRGSGNESSSSSTSSAASSSSPSSNTNSQSSNDDESMSEPEKEALKFLDSIPGANNANKEPSTFRERLGDTFGLLREGVSNQFKSWRENLSDTVEDLRDTWSNES